MRSMATSLIAAFTAAACAGQPDQAPSGDDDAAHDAAAATDDGSAAGVHDAHAEEAGHSHAVAAPGEGETLLAIMVKLGADMAALTHGVMTEDTALVARIAAEIADHAPIAPGEIERIHTELGAEMAEFERIDEEVHEASVALREVSRSGDMDAILGQLHEVQRGCVACHTTFRDRLRTNPARQD